MIDINAIRIDCASILRMWQHSTVIDRGGGGSGTGIGTSSDGSSCIQLDKNVKNIRLTHCQLKQHSRCKGRLVLLLLGLWMNLISVTNGKCLTHVLSSSFLRHQISFSCFHSMLISSNLISFHSVLLSVSFVYFVNDTYWVGLLIELPLPTFI